MSKCLRCGAESNTPFCESCIRAVEAERQERAGKELQSPQAFLEHVRNRTCYPGLREMLSLLAGLSIIMVVVSAGAGVYAALEGGSLVTTIIVLTAGLAGCILATAAKRLAVVLIDIADAFMDQSRRRREVVDEDAA